MPFQIIRDDITRVVADAIVNTANPDPTFGGGTDAAIYASAGRRRLLKEREKIGVINPGEAAVTPAFKLPAKYIIHTVGPVWRGGASGEFDTLRSCYEKSLDKAKELGCKSIAFPLIATGIYGFPKDKALQVALNAIQGFLLENEMQVTLVVFDRKAFELSGSVISDIRSYVDSNYVEAAEEREYSICMEREEPCCDSAPQRSRHKGTLGRKSERVMRSIDAMSMVEEMPMAEAMPMVASRPMAAAMPKGGALVLEKTFQEKLFEIIDSRGLTGPQVYKNYISKQVFSKIQSDREYHPNKFTALALCLSLHLDVEQTQDLIGRAGWALSPSNKTDVIVKGCIVNHEYNLVNINCILFDYDCPELERIK